jgi:hypothetical protein
MSPSSALTIVQDNMEDRAIADFEDISASFRHKLHDIELSMLLDEEFIAHAMPDAKVLTGTTLDDFGLMKKAINGVAGGLATVALGYGRGLRHGLHGLQLGIGLCHAIGLRPGRGQAQGMRRSEMRLASR